MSLNNEAIGENIQEINEDIGEDRIDSIGQSALKNEDIFKNIFGPIAEYPDRKNSEFSVRPSKSKLQVFQS
jgi:hypothetical protein